MIVDFVCLHVSHCHTVSGAAYSKSAQCNQNEWFTKWLMCLRVSLVTLHPVGRSVELEGRVQSG